VDNNSSDQTADVLLLVDGAKIVRNSDNRGFGSAVMQAVALASGKFLCLLNNDILLERGALIKLLDVFCERPPTGAVGGKIVLANGQLQEVGCIIWRDGRTHQYGRGDDPTLPQYTFRRPVDYCSGALLMTPRMLFLALGGLDEQYGVGYHEDVDYCLKVWQAGKSVMYEPRAVIHHYEGASSDSLLAIHDTLLRNHGHFTSLWSTALRLRRVEQPENVCRARIFDSTGVPRQLYFIDQSGISMMRSKCSELRRTSATAIVTCILLPDVDSLTLRSEFSIDVELRSFDTMSTEEVQAYCDGADLIVISVNRPLSYAMTELADMYSAKANLL